MDSRSIISVKEARKLMGRDSQSLTDDQIIEIVDTLTDIARQFLQNTGSKNELGV